MKIRIVSAPARPVRRSFFTTVAILSIFAVSAVHAQAPAPAPAPAPAAPKPAAPKPKPPAAAPKTPAAPPAAAQQPPPAQPPAQQSQAPGGPVEMPQLIYSPWAKFCGKGQDPNAKQVCFTGKDARTEAGVPVVAAALIEPDGEPKKIFRITLPSPLQLRFGTRLIIDQQQPLEAPFFTCFSNGCMADYEGNPDVIAKIKKGQMLTIQAINLAGNAISFPLPLTDFAKANEGPPTDPKVFEEQQKKLQDELQKRAEDARKKLEQQQGTPPAAPK
jgi:invasion protein IalB